MLQFTTAIVVCTSIVTDIPKRAMPYEAWHPYNITTDLRYSVAFTHHTVAHIWGAYVSLAYDTLLLGMILQDGIQFKILEYRFKTMSNTIKTGYQNITVWQREKQELAKYVKHHLVIFELSYLILLT